MFDRKLVKLVEVYDSGYNRDTKSIREVYINPNFIASMMPDYNMISLLKEGKLPEGLDRNQQFTRIILSDGKTEHIVLGEINVVQSKLSPTLLKG